MVAGCNGSPSTTVKPTLSKMLRCWLLIFDVTTTIWRPRAARALKAFSVMPIDPSRRDPQTTICPEMRGNNASRAGRVTEAIRT